MKATSFRLVVRILLFTAVAAGLAIPSALAQFSSGIEGTAHDQTGATLVGARVIVNDTRLGVNKTTVTNQEGYFRIDSIAASTYTVQIQIAGFKTWSQPDLTLQVGEMRTLAPVLEVGRGLDGRLGQR